MNTQTDFQTEGKGGKKHKIIWLTLVSLLLLAFLFWALVLPQFYTPRKQVLIGSAIGLTDGLQEDIAKKLLNHEPIESGFVETREMTEDVSPIYMSSNGDLIFMVDKDTLIWLHPKVVDDRVIWSCERAPKEYANPSCDYKERVF